MKLKSLVFICIPLFILIFCWHNVYSLNITRQYSISGRTMGTYYNVVVLSHKKVIVSNLKKSIDVQLKMINNQMSLYQISSEISRFNKAPINTPVHISKDFFKVLKEAENLYRITNGAWDGTIRPLYNLWKFDTTKNTAKQIPSPKAIKACLKKTGFNNIIIKDKILIKKIKDMSLDLGSIAKGYGVDVVANLLKDFGFKNFSVEIGGEVYVSGKKHQKKWQIGIANPSGFNGPNPYKIINISGKAIATSGTYRNYYKFNNKIFSHILNPKTGSPINNNIVSISVVAGNCMVADGLATGLMVMGTKKALALVNSLDDTECMIITRKTDQSLEPFFSDDFKKYLIR